MGTRARLLPLVAAVAVTLPIVPRADAKPTIHVEVTIDAADRRLREKLERDLRSAGVTASMEDFLEERFIETFSLLKMFRFVNRPVAPEEKAPIRLTITVASKSKRWRYPREDVAMTLLLNDGSDPRTLTLFQKCTCGTPPCAPEDLSDPAWYQRTFQRAIEEWPRGLFKSIVLTTTASYERGSVRTIEPITEFGERHLGAPNAIFEIAYDDKQRWFALCQAKKEGRWSTLGFDQGNPERPVAPHCRTPRSPPNEKGLRGQVTLLRAFPW